MRILNANGLRAPSIRRTARRLARVVRRTRVPHPRLGDYRPRSQLRVPTHDIPSAAFPAVDAHAHLGRWLTGDGSWMESDVKRLLGIMDAANLATLVNLDGRWGSELQQNLTRYDEAHPGRFATFCHVDWSMLSTGHGGAELAASLADSVAVGARGLKVWKDLGFSVRDAARELVLADDPRLSELWDAAGDLNVPVLFHVADPIGFFTPLDRHNELLMELRRSPASSRAALGVAGHDFLLAAFEHILERHRGTTFIAAHLASCAHDLQRVAAMLRSHPNLFVDVSARAAEIGRQPRVAARFIEGNGDRVLFGADIWPVRQAEYGVWFRLLETDDDCFPYSTAEVLPQGGWNIYGLQLSDTTLRQVYKTNALRVIPGLTTTSL